MLSKELFAQLSELVRTYRDYQHKLDLNQVLYASSESSSSLATSQQHHDDDDVTRLDKLMLSLRSHMSSLPLDVRDQCIGRLKELVRKGFKC